MVSCIKYDVFHLRYFHCLVLKHPKGDSPLVLDALLLFALPSELTLQKLFELPELGERSHQLVADRSIIDHNLLYLFFLFKTFFVRFYNT